MPEYFLHEMGMPCVRRNHGINRKIHRNYKGLSGPNLICKYPMHSDCHYTADYFLGSDGKLRNSNHLNSVENDERLPSAYTVRPFRSLIVASHIAVDRFCVPYSLNKCERWEIFDQIRDSLYDLQDSEIGLRVSLLRTSVSCFQDWFNYPETRVRFFTSEDDIVTEFHGYNKQKKVEIIGRHVKQSQLLSEPPKKGKKKGRRDWLHIRRPQTESVPHDKKMMHLFVKEQVVTYHPGIINSRGRRPKERMHQTNDDDDARSRKGRKQRAHVSRRKMRHRIADPDFEPKDDVGTDHSHCTKSEEYLPIKVAHEMPHICHFDGTYMASDRSTELSCLEDYLITKSNKINCCKRRKHRKENWTVEYEKWYRSNPSCSSAAAEKNEQKSSVVSSDTYLDFVELRQFTVTMGNEKNADFIKNIEKNARKIDGLYPQTYRCDIPASADLLSTYVPPECLQNFAGIAVLQPVVSSGLMRIILNPGEVTPKKEEVMFRSVRLKDSNHILDSFAGPCETYDARIAEAAALCRIYRGNEPGPSWPHLPDAPFCCCVCDAFGEDGFALHCGHFTCRACWTEHATYKLHAASLPIRCPEYGCPTILTDNQLISLLPLSICQRYRKLLSDKEFMRPQWLHCINCPKILYNASNSSAKRIAKCSCGEYMCMECRDKLHPPLTCSEAELYRSFCESVRADDIDTNVRLKRCPACRNFCERSEGCNHMTCICGAEFCYVCNEKWISYVYHEYCTEDTFVEVELLDVPNKLYSRIPLKVFGECKQYRNNRHAKKLHELRSSLRRVFGRRNHQNEHITVLFAVACQFLEFSVLKAELLSRSAKRTTECSLAFSMKAGKLRRQIDSLRFHLTRLKALLDCSTPNSHSIARVVQNLENTLRLCLSDAFS